MRNQRERRNELNWNFCNYFLLQEELAFVYQMLGAYDEALVQYDELDALFTQFVLNSNVSGKQNCPNFVLFCPNFSFVRFVRFPILSEFHTYSIFNFFQFSILTNFSILSTLHSPIFIFAHFSILTIFNFVRFSISPISNFSYFQLYLIFNFIRISILSNFQFYPLFNFV